MSDRKLHIVDKLIEGDEEGATAALLLEAEEEDLLAHLGGETTLMNYLIKFEEYLDDHDIYLFKGWDKAVIVGKPKVEKFWTTIDVMVAPDTDLRGALRVVNDKEGQNKVSKKKTKEGVIVRFKILKRYLDQIEQRNKERSDQLSDEEMENQ